MKQIKDFLKQHNLKPETKRTLSVCAASALAEAYVNLLPREGLGVSALGFVKDGPEIIFYLDVSQVESQLNKIFEKQSITLFIDKYKEIFNQSKKELLKGNLEAYPDYFRAMGAIKALTRYVGNSDRLKEYHQLIGALFNEIAEVYPRVEKNLTPQQKQATLFELRNQIEPKKREKGFLLYDGKWHEWDEIPEIVIETKDNLEGKGVSGGLVSGRVSLTPQPNCIYITSMTRPIDTPIMNKVAAIVTDEGGLLCHAAIVAREFGIPCVVGTKMATKVFKEGEMVEVDASKGIVRKL